MIRDSCCNEAEQEGYLRALEDAAKIVDKEYAEWGGGGNVAAACYQMAAKIRALGETKPARLEASREAEPRTCCSKQRIVTTRPAMTDRFCASCRCRFPAAPKPRTAADVPPGDDPIGNPTGYGDRFGRY